MDDSNGIRFPHLLGNLRSFLSSFKTLMVILGIPIGAVGALGLAYVLSAHLGLGTILINLHYGTFIVTFFFIAFIIDFVYFLKAANHDLTTLLKFSAIALFALVVAIVILGLAADIPVMDPGSLSGIWSTPYSSVSQTVTADQANSWCNALLTDMMEHTSLLGPGLAAVIASLVWNYKDRVLTDRAVKRNVLVLLGIGLAWALVLGLIGVILTKTLTLPPGV